MSPAALVLVMDFNEAAGTRKSLQSLPTARVISFTERGAIVAQNLLKIYSLVEAKTYLVLFFFSIFLEEMNDGS